MISVNSSRLIASWLLLAPLLTACGENQQQAAPPPPAVTVAKPVKQMVTDQDEYVGRFVAVDAVEVRTRVAGTLDAVHFKDGQIVTKGDLLFTIDRRPFENTLAQARANLLLAHSNLTFAESDLTRGQQLVRERTISEQVYDQRAQTKRNAEASVAANQAAVSQAELDLQFTEVRAPIGGRIGDRRVSPGNLVASGATATLLATIVSTDPIRFEFTFDEASLLRYERLTSQQVEDSPTRGLSLSVKLRLIDEKDFSHDGKMDFVDNVIDRSTGTIRVRAVVANPKGLFVPGMFARVQIPASPPQQAFLVPDAAIGTDQTRKFVYVVEADNAVKQAYVTLGAVFGDLRVVRGLEPDARVVVNGLMRIRPGIKVTPQEEGAAPPAPGPSAAATN
jgi:RND family efflux transporter MFP subunit